MPKISTLLLLTFLATTIQAQSIQDLVNQTSLSNLTTLVNELSGESATNVNGIAVTITDRVSSSDNNIAADYIKEKLTAYGLTINDQIYSAGVNGGRNIIATQTGVTNPNNIYLISAHYDSVANYGADDNASGTAAIIELARIMAPYCTDNTIVYALFDQEETGLNGSAYYAQQAQTNGDNILGAFNIDMMGYDDDDDNNFDIDVRNIANSIAMKNQIIDVLNTTAYGFNLVVNVVNPGTGASDHGSFWNRGYSAVLFGECWSKNDQTSGYHSNNDRIGLFNMPYYHEMSKLVVAYIATVSNPIFIDKSVTENSTSLTSNATTGFTYQWIDCNNSNTPITGATNQSFTPISNGSYAVNITKGNCTETSNCYAFNTLGLNSFTLNKFKVYPNPASNQITIEIPLFVKVDVEIVNVTGQLILSKKLTLKKNSINISNLESGIYFVRLNIDGKKIDKKLVKSSKRHFN